VTSARHQRVRAPLNVHRQLAATPLAWVDCLGCGQYLSTKSIDLIGFFALADRPAIAPTARDRSESSWMTDQRIEERGHGVPASPVAATDQPLVAAGSAVSISGEERAGPPHSRRLRRVLPFVLPVLVIALWQSIAQMHWINTVLFPSPTQVAATLWGEVRDGSLWRNTRVSLIRWAVGFAIGGGLGVALGALVGLFRIAESLLDTSFQMLRTVPHLGLMPLLVLWLGLGTLPMLVMITLASFFPVYLNTTSGIRNVDSKLIEVGRVHSLGWLQLLRRVVLPAALPSIFTGIRYGLGVAWLALIIAELMGATSGLGYLVTEGESLSNVDIVVGGIVIFAIVGKVIDVLVKLAEKRFLGWRDTYAGS
jgi:sulfonate transport system permease protein